MPKLEIWKTVVGWDGYEVSNRGRVRCKPGFDRMGRRKGGLKKLTRDKKSGRWFVGLVDNKRRATVQVHWLVLEAFRGPRPPGADGRHLDDDKDNNDIRNLAWGTRKQNMEDAVRNGRVPRGETHGCVKLTEAQVRQFLAEYREAPHRGGRQCRLRFAKKFGVNATYLWRIAKGHRWAHLGVGVGG